MSAQTPAAAGYEAHLAHGTDGHAFWTTTADLADAPDFTLTVLPPSRSLQGLVWRPLLQVEEASSGRLLTTLVGQAGAAAQVLALDLKAVAVAAAAGDAGPLTWPLKLTLRPGARLSGGSGDVEAFTAAEAEVTLHSIQEFADRPATLVVGSPGRAAPGAWSDGAGATAERTHLYVHLRRGRDAARLLPLLNEGRRFSLGASVAGDSSPRIQLVRGGQVVASLAGDLATRAVVGRVAALFGSDYLYKGTRSALLLAAKPGKVLTPAEVDALPASPALFIANRVYGEKSYILRADFAHDSARAAQFLAGSVFAVFSEPVEILDRPKDSAPVPVQAPAQAPGAMPLAH